jgi:UDP-N-acetylmuramate dehydrogenase
MQKLWIVNKAAQPLQEQYAAMVFKDAGGITAASLIDQAGLKGARINDIELSDRNANFLIAQPGGSARDALALIEHLRERVDERLGIELEMALEIW